MSPGARLQSRLVDLLLGHPTWGLEVYLAVQSFVWGVWLLGPWEAFDVIPDLWSVLGIVPEWAWGTLFTGHGLAHGYSLMRRDPTLCRRAALALAGLWSIVTASLLVTVPLAVSTPIYGLNVVACAFVYMRLHWRFA